MPPNSASSNSSVWSMPVAKENICSGDCFFAAERRMSCEWRKPFAIAAIFFFSPLAASPAARRRVESRCSRHGYQPGDPSALTIALWRVDERLLHANRPDCIGPCAAYSAKGRAVLSEPPQSALRRSRQASRLDGQVFGVKTPPRREF